MNRFEKKIKVVPNPFYALDHKGRPCGLVPVEPNSVGGFLGYVGAKISRTKTKILRVRRKDGDVRGGRQDTVIEHSTEPVTVPKTAYYRDALRCGSLLPASKAVADWAGVKTFVEPVEALKLARDKAEKAFEEAYGEGALASIQERFEELSNTPAKSKAAEELAARKKAQEEAEELAAQVAEKAAEEARARAEADENRNAPKTGKASK